MFIPELTLHVPLYTNTQRYKHTNTHTHIHTPNILYYSKYMPGIVLDILHIYIHYIFMSRYVS